MRHAHGPIGENVPEIFQTADAVLRKGWKLPSAKSFAVADGKVRAVFDLRGRAAKGYDLCWTASDGDWRERKWERKRTLSSANEFSAPLPQDARAVYVNLVLEEPTGEKTYPEFIVSTKAWFADIVR